LCGKYGGGAFLVAYIVMLVTCAAPLFFYETILGQKFQRGPAETFRKMAPRWVGLAYVPVLMTFFYLPYYQLIVAYAFHYLMVSFKSPPLPWVDGTTPDRYLDEVVLNRVESLGDEGGASINGRLFFEVIVVWIITALCLVKGIHSAGKAAYVTVILPVIMIVVLFIVCIQLPGAAGGLHYYLVPRWEMLLRPDVWGLAAGQIIFSLSPGTGTCISLASYHEREYRGLFTDCMFVAVCNSAFSIFGGLVVFSVVGNLALTLHKPVEEVAASGEGLAFIVFAQGLSQIGGGLWSSAFSALFFMTLFLLGLDSAFAIVETLQTYANDWVLARNPGSKISARGNAFRLIVMSCVLLCIGLPYVTRAGYILLEIADHFIVTYALVIGVLLEYIMIGYVYTAEQMLEDVFVATGVRLPEVACWQIRYIAPAMLTAVVIMLLISEVTDTAMRDYPGWAVFLFGVLPVGLSLSSVAMPCIQFRLRRLLLSGVYTPEGLEAVRKRASSSGFRSFFGSSAGDADEGGKTTADNAPLSMHRA
jgi:SNF family Na+-dependent transporter